MALGEALGRELEWQWSACAGKGIVSSVELMKVRSKRGGPCPSVCPNAPDEAQ